MVHAEAPERGVDGVEEVLPRQAPVVGAVAHGEVGLGGHDDLVAAGQVAHGPAQDLLARPARVHVGGVEEVDAVVEGLAHELPAGLLGQDPVPPARRAVGHHAEAEARDLQAGTSERDVFHGIPCGRAAARPAAGSATAISRCSAAGGPARPSPSAPMGAQPALPGVCTVLRRSSQPAHRRPRLLGARPTLPGVCTVLRRRRLGGASVVGACRAGRLAAGRRSSPVSERRGIPPRTANDSVGERPTRPSRADRCRSRRGWPRRR